MSSATEIREIQIQARKKHIRLKTRNKKKSVSSLPISLPTKLREDVNILIIILPFGELV